jgi:hypothetical protein
MLAPSDRSGLLITLSRGGAFEMLGTCALIMWHLAGLVFLRSDFLAGILFLRQSLIKGRGLSWIW